MTRSFYQQNEKKFQNYIDNHVTVVGTENEMASKQNQNMLLSKINAQMLIQCEKQINKEQIAALQKYKFKPQNFRSSQDGFSQLVDVDFSQFDISQSENESGEPAQIRFT